MSYCVVDIFKTFVDAVRDDYTPLSGFDSDAPFYMYGHPIEIVNTLKQKNKNGTFKFKKYPLIALFQDFDEVKGENMAIDSRVSLRVVIAVNTSPKYVSSERYANTFKPVLYPLYNLLMEKIAKSPYTQLAEGIVPHTKTDRVYWGKTGINGNEANVFDDYLDAIEITDLELELYNNVKIC